MNKEHLLFLINPISGGRSKLKIPELIAQNINADQFSVEIVVTEYAGHATEIIKSRLEIKETIVAVGGDGTINEVAKVLAGTSKIMGIIPQGSGNGLARHLGIALDPQKALLQLNNSLVSNIDTAELNGNFFISIAGVGFDSLIAQKFVSSQSRGFLGYAQLAISEFFKFREQDFQLKLDGESMNRKAALISFANSNQFGYNTKIAPQASLQDGLLDICIMRKPKLYQMPSILLKVWTGKADRSSLLEIIQAKSLCLQPNPLRFANVDGESMEVGEEVCVEIKPSNLKIRIPKH